MDTNPARRQFLTAAALFGIGTTLGRAVAAETTGTAAAKTTPALTLPALPWDPGALAPVISANTIGFHHGKHHQTYIDNLNKLIAGTPHEGKALADIVKASAGKADQVAVFNNAAQAWNHGFYWNSLSPKGGGKPGADVAARVDYSFGSLDELRKAYLAAATGQFGSGWVWLALDVTSNKLVVLKTANADTPLTGGSHRPLAVLDVWEHAYYLDYQNRRADYATAVFDKLLNWSFVEANLAAA